MKRIWHFLLGDDQVKPILLKSKLTMPRLDHDILCRSELQERLSQLGRYSVTSVVAGAGYGKTTAVVQALADSGFPCCWYNPGPEDDNIFAFSTYLAGALDQLRPGFKDWYFASIEAEKQLNWKNAFAIFLAGMESYAGGTAVLAIDDWHLVQKDAEIQQFFDRFLACRPTTLNIVLLSRERINLPEIKRLQVCGKLLKIQDIDLMFRYDETGQWMGRVLPHQYTEAEIRKIYDITEGWIMGIRLFTTNSGAKRLRKTTSIQEQLEEMDTLFDYLAHDVLVRQSPDLQNFLLKSAIFDSFTVKDCQAVLGSAYRYELLEAAFKQGLFLSEVGKGIYRYHQLFREFLSREAVKRIADMPFLCGRAGAYYLQQGESERALQYFILGGESEQALEVLGKIARGLVHSGRSRMLHQFLSQMPTAESRPEIMLALGDEARFACQYKIAVKFYEKASAIYHAAKHGIGESAANLGLGEIYLDIIQPMQAEKYLRRAYKALSVDYVEKRTAILVLMAENSINQGNPKRAERYSQLARKKIDFEDKNNLTARILLRTGRLQEVIALKEKELPLDKSIYHVPCSFRESSLILAVCYVYVGQAAEALSSARQGIEIGEQLNSPFISAIGYARLGHALMIQPHPDLEDCWAAYRQSLEISSRLDAPRSLTEVLQGQSLLHAMAGDWDAAEACGRQGIAITEKCCDRWFTAVLYHTLGMSAALCKHFAEAVTYLQQACRLFQLCGDHFGQAVSTWWSANIALWNGQEVDFADHFRSLIALCREHQCGFLLERPSLLGDIRHFTSEPLFAEARRLEIEVDLVDNPSARSSYKKIFRQEAAGQQYKLRIQTLGELKVWRNGKELTASGWRRESSRHLFALLLATRHEPLHKEVLMEHLWPEADAIAADRNFKVALSNLMIVLEPDRQPRQPSSIIQRKGTLYQFKVNEKYYIDADEFENLTQRAAGLLKQNSIQAEMLLRKSVSLYQGDFLDCDLPNEIFQAERERLSSLFIHALESLAGMCMAEGRNEEALHWADVLLHHDKCWEQAYQLKMQCYDHMKNIPMVVRTYKKCCTVLQEELGVRQSEQTLAIYRRILSQNV